MSPMANSRRRKINPRLLAALALFLLGGCSGKAAYVTKDYYPGERPEWVAVLPFELAEGEDSDLGVEQILRQSFYESFVYLGYLDRGLAETDKKLEGLGLLDPRKRDNHLAPGKLGEVLKADYLIYGTVHRAVNSTGILFDETFIRAHLKMVEAATGRVVWSKDHAASVLNSLIVPESAVKIIQDKALSADTPKALHHVAESFAKEIVKTMKDPADKLVHQDPLPKIRSMDVRVKEAGSAEEPVLWISLTGDPRMKAAFDIGNWKTNIPMLEVRPGEYEGSYKGQAGDAVENCLVVGKLTGEDGITGTRVYRERLVSFGGKK